MLNSSVTKLVSVLFVAILVQVFLIGSMSVIHIALASGEESSNNDESAFENELFNNASGPWQSNGGFTVSSNNISSIKTLPSGNLSVTVGGGGGQTHFYSNGNGTWNTITYPPENETPQSEGLKQYYGGEDPCPYGQSPRGEDGQCLPDTSCPANQTLIGGSCCPNANIVTSTQGSGKGQTTTRTCNIPPPTPPTATISQSKASTEIGEQFTITYGRSGGGTATSCVLQHQAPGASYTQIGSNNGNTSNINDNIGTPGSYNYRAQCYGPGGSSSWASLTHNVVVPPPTVTFTADQYIIPYNTATTLRWNSQNTVSCSASGAWSGSKAINGSEGTANLTDLTTYFLQCQGRANQTTSPAVVNINIDYGENSTIEIDPVITHKNTPVIVTWDTGTSDPANCQIEAGSIILQSGLTSTTGSLTHTVTGETTFTINCENNHNNAEATVKVLPEFQET